MTIYQQAWHDARDLFAGLGELESTVETAGMLCAEALRGGHKILACGNGGSAAEAQHLVGELMGRYKENRRPFAAVALSADASTLTCIGNDFCYDDVFARQVRGLGRTSDVLVAFTTSGNSPNVVRALETARELGMHTIAFLGRDGGKARPLADCPVIVSHSDTARAQEGHQFLMHCLMDQIEAKLAAAGERS